MALATRMISILDKTIRQNRGYFEETDFAIDYHDLLKLKKRKVMKKEQKIIFVLNMYYLTLII